MIHFEDIVGDVVVRVRVIVQVIMIVMRSQQRVIAAHLVPNGDWLTRRRILWRLDVAHPHRVMVALVADLLLQHELVAAEAAEVLGALERKAAAVGQNGLRLNALVGGAVDLQASLHILGLVGGDGRNLQRRSELAAAAQLIGFDGALIVVDARAVR